MHPYTPDQAEERRQVWVAFLSTLAPQDQVQAFGKSIFRLSIPPWTFDASFGSTQSTSDLDVTVSGGVEILSLWRKYVWTILPDPGGLPFSTRWNSNFFYEPLLGKWKDTQPRSRKECQEVVRAVRLYCLGGKWRDDETRCQEDRRWAQIQQLGDRGGLRVHLQRASLKVEGFLSFGSLYSAGVLNDATGCPAPPSKWARRAGAYELLCNMYIHSRTEKGGGPVSFRRGPLQMARKLEKALGLHFKENPLKQQLECLLPEEKALVPFKYVRRLYRLCRRDNQLPPWSNIKAQRFVPWSEVGHFVERIVLPLTLRL